MTSEKGVHIPFSAKVFCVPVFVYFCVCVYVCAYVLLYILCEHPSLTNGKDGVESSSEPYCSNSQLNGLLLLTGF